MERRLCGRKVAGRAKPQRRECVTHDKNEARRISEGQTSSQPEEVKRPVLAFCSPAWYELRTKGPASTCLKP